MKINNVVTLITAALLAAVGATFSLPGKSSLLDSMTHSYEDVLNGGTLPEVVVSSTPDPDLEELEPAHQPDNPLLEQIKKEFDNNKTQIFATSSTKPRVLDLNKQFTAVLNKTDFDSLMDQVFKKMESDALIDIHFNRYKGNSSGPLMIHSKAGEPLARALQREFVEIYEENRWVIDKEFDLRTEPDLALITRGNKLNKPVVISEFGYVDDPNNPIAAYIQTEAGQRRIARAYHNAARGLGLENIALSIGHHGDRGTDGAQVEDYHEMDFAIDVINQVYLLTFPAPTDKPAEGYHHGDGEQFEIRQDLRNPRNPYTEIQPEVVPVKPQTKKKPTAYTAKKTKSCAT